MEDFNLDSCKTEDLVSQTPIGYPTGTLAGGLLMALFCASLDALEHGLSIAFPISAVLESRINGA